MAITEVFGGMYNMVLTLKHIGLLCSPILSARVLCTYHVHGELSIIFTHCFSFCFTTEFRTGKTQLSHTLCGRLLCT